MKIRSQSKINPLVVIATLFVFWLGCSTVSKVEQAQQKSVEQMEILKEQSVGKIPCRSNEIEISEFNINQADGSGYWTAFCEGNTYKCVRSGKDQDVHCVPIDKPET
jgi:hypothetical protein